jgi:hypothetical protein
MDYNHLESRETQDPREVGWRGISRSADDSDMTRNNKQQVGSFWQV